MAAVLLAIMLFAQIGIAQHSTIHFTDHGHYEQSHGTHDHHDHRENNKNASESCQICVITKSLSLGLIVKNTELKSRALSKHTHVEKHNDIISRSLYKAYNSRAPPTLLV